MLKTKVMAREVIRFKKPEPKIVQNSEREVELLLYSEEKKDYQSASKGFAFCNLYACGGPMVALIAKFDEQGTLKFDVFGFIYFVNEGFSLIPKCINALEVSYDENVFFYQTEKGWFGVDCHHEQDFFAGCKRIAYNLFASKHKYGTTCLGWYDVEGGQFRIADYTNLLFEKSENANDIDVVAAQSVERRRWDIFEGGDRVCQRFYKMRIGDLVYVFRFNLSGYQIAYNGSDTLPEGLPGGDRMVWVSEKNNFGKLLIFNQGEDFVKSGKINIVNNDIVFVDDEVIFLED